MQKLSLNKSHFNAKKDEKFNYNLLSVVFLLPAVAQQLKSPNQEMNHCKVTEHHLRFTIQKTKPS
jgi:hypothetical protein